jgi:hypothetical protein
MSSDWPQITYEQAKAAYQAGQKLHLGGRIYLVRPALSDGAVKRGVPGSDEGPVLWVTDERTLGDHGLLLFPDGRVANK